jgi:hypothetical protein
MQSALTFIVLPAQISDVATQTKQFISFLLLRGVIFGFISRRFLHNGIGIFEIQENFLLLIRAFNFVREKGVIDVSNDVFDE